MRETHYRAWIIPLKTWADEINMEFTNYGFPSLITACMQGRPDYIGDDEIILEQYTGLKDKHGTPIYEGDIINFTYWWFDGAERESNLCGDVVYLNDRMSYGLRHVRNSEWCKHTGANREVGDTDAFAVWLFDEADFEIIGNVHQHPELIERKR